MVAYKMVGYKMEELFSFSGARGPYCNHKISYDITGVPVYVCIEETCIGLIAVLTAPSFWRIRLPSEALHMANGFMASPAATNPIVVDKCRGAKSTHFKYVYLHKKKVSI